MFRNLFYLCQFVLNLIIHVTDFVDLPFGRIFDDSDELAIIALICKQKRNEF